MLCGVHMVVCNVGIVKTLFLYGRNHDGVCFLIGHAM